MKQLSLIQLKQGMKGKVISFDGRQGLENKLSERGIRLGKEITVISDTKWKGPVTISLGNNKVAIGYGMAAKVIVEVKK